MLVETQYGTFFVHKTGTGKRTLVMLHGLGSAGTTFAKIWPDLQDYNLVVPDLLGFGRSTVSGTFSYSFLDQAQSVLQLLDHLNLDTLSLLGHSMGGCVAMAVAHMDMARVEKLIVAEPNLIPTRALATPSISARADKISEGDYVSRFPEIFSDFEPNKNGSISSRLYWDTLQQASPVAMYRVSQALLDLNEFDVWKAYNTCVNASFVGERSIEGIHVKLSLTGSVPIYQIAGAGHNMFVENPHSCIKAIRQVLDGTKP